MWKEKEEKVAPGYKGAPPGEDQQGLLTFFRERYQKLASLPVLPVAALNFFPSTRLSRQKALSLSAAAIPRNVVTFV